MLLKVILVSLVLVGGVLSAREEDKVDFLPGLEEQPDFDHYAGYLKASNGSRFFYWFVESENDPANDPVVLWLNGGPGCSSLTGFLVELGPWRVLPDGSGLEWFEQRWNKIANIIFMESPSCVGYSYNERGDCSSGDNQVAYDNHEALKDFFEGFPEYKDNDFYITGESYAGIYVPTLSARIVDDPEFNFIGFAVGNAVTDRWIMDDGLTPYLWARGLFGTSLYNDVVGACCDNYNTTDCPFGRNRELQCRAQMTRVSDVQWRIGLNPYNYLQECFGGAPNSDLIYSEDETSVRMVLPDSIHMSPEDADKYLQFVRQKAKDKEVRASIPCTDTSDRDTYLNNPAVREALHVPEFVQQWEACSTNVSINYDREYRTVKDEYLKVLERGKRVLVFNGDLDIACNHLGDMWFVEDLNQPLLPNGDYDEWFVGEDENKQIAGWTLQYENLVYNQVLGAGHFVPTDKPVAAYIMWEKYINDEAYP